MTKAFTVNNFLSDIQTMVNIVKFIESSREVETDEKFMRSLRRQLKTSKSDINKLKQSTVLCNLMMTPIHAAVLSENLDILEMLLETKDVDVGALAIFKTEKTEVKYGALDLAICLLEKPNIGTVELLLNKIDSPVLTMLKPTRGTGFLPLASCLRESIRKEYLDILDLLLSKPSLVKSNISPYYTLLHTIFLNKQTVFNHVLPRVKDEINRRICWNGSHVTPLEIAQKVGTQKMCRQIIEAGGEVSQPCWHCVREKILSSLKEEFDEVTRFDAAAFNDNEEEDDISVSAPHNDNFDQKKEAVPLPHTESDNHEKDGVTDKSLNIIDKSERNVEETKDQRNEGKAVKIKVCWKCSSSAKSLCTGCRKARYCGERCQEEDWEKHKEYCLAKMNRIAFKEFRCLSTTIFA